MTQIKAGDRVIKKETREEFTVNKVGNGGVYQCENEKRGEWLTIDEIELLTDPELNPGMRVKDKLRGTYLTLIEIIPDGDAWAGEWRCNDFDGYSWVKSSKELELIPFEPTMIIQPPQDNVKEQQEFIDSSLRHFTGSLILMNVPPDEASTKALQYAKELLQIRNKNLIK